MKKLLKISLILIVILSVFTQMNFCYAKVFKDTIYSDESVESADLDKYKPDDLGEEKEVVDKAKIVVTVIRNIGVIVAVIALMVIGIKTMFGSLEEKSKYKEALPGYIIGVILVIAITTLPSIIQQLTTETFK